VPGAYFWIGHDGSVPVNNPSYVLDDKVLPIGASMFARIIETRMPGAWRCDLFRFGLRRRGRTDHHDGPAR
jgi:hypothetical protein